MLGHSCNLSIRRLSQTGDKNFEVSLVYIAIPYIYPPGGWRDDSV